MDSKNMNKVVPTSNSEYVELPQEDVTNNNGSGVENIEDSGMIDMLE